MTDYIILKELGGIRKALERVAEALENWERRQDG